MHKPVQPKSTPSNALVRFADRNALTVPEVAGRLACWPQHVHHLIEAGQLGAIDIKVKGSRRSLWRVPIESFATFVALGFSGREREEALRALPRAALVALLEAVKHVLDTMPGGPTHDGKGAS